MKKVAGIDTFNLALKSSLSRLKAEADEINIDKLKPVLVDLSKLSNLVNNEIVKKTVYDKLAAKVNSVDTSWFVLKTTYGTDELGLKNKISDADKKFLTLVDLLKNRL